VYSSATFEQVDDVEVLLNDGFIVDGYVGY
jgi:hypothetical protein